MKNLLFLLQGREAVDSLAAADVEKRRLIVAVQDRAEGVGQGERCAADLQFYVVSPVR